MSNQISNWEEFKEAATEIFNVWMYGSELAWAEEIWGVLSKAGLTDFETELERTQVCIRLMTLGAIYHDFCYIVWQEGNVLLTDWGHDLGIQPFHLGRLIGQDLDAFEEVEGATDESECLDRTYTILTDAERRTIHRALCPEPGDCPKVYLALYLTSTVRSVGGEDDAWELTGPNSAALEFVMNGFTK